MASPLPWIILVFIVLFLIGRCDMNSAIQRSRTDSHNTATPVPPTEPAS